MAFSPTIYKLHIFVIFSQTLSDFCFFCQKRSCPAVVPALRRANFPIPYIHLFSANDQRFLNFSRKKVGNRTSLSGLSPVRAANWPLFFEKNRDFFLDRRLRSPVRIPHGNRFSDSLKCLSLQRFCGQYLFKYLTRKRLRKISPFSENTQKPETENFRDL